MWVPRAGTLPTPLHVHIHEPLMWSVMRFVNGLREEAAAAAAAAAASSGKDSEAHRI